VGARFSAPVQTDPRAYPASCTMDTGSFPGVKSGRDVTLTPHSLQCRGQERVELYLYSRYGPYGLDRASVPVQGCTYYLTLWLGIHVDTGEGKNVVSGEKINSIRIFVGDYSRFGYSCADNTKVNHENMEESGKPCIKLEESCSILRKWQ